MSTMHDVMRQTRTITQSTDIHSCISVDNTQIVTGIEANSEAYFPQLREISLTIYR